MLYPCHFPRLLSPSDYGDNVFVLLGHALPFVLAALFNSNSLFVCVPFWTVVQRGKLRSCPPARALSCLAPVVPVPSFLFVLGWKKDDRDARASRGAGGCRALALHSRSQSPPLPHWVARWLCLTRVVRSRIEVRSTNLCTRIEIAIFWSLRIDREENRHFHTFLHHFWPFEAMIKSRIEAQDNNWSK